MGIFDKKKGHFSENPALCADKKSTSPKKFHWLGLLVDPPGVSLEIGLENSEKLDHRGRGGSVKPQAEACPGPRRNIIHTELVLLTEDNSADNPRLYWLC